MPRYKRSGPMIVVEPPTKVVEEIPLGELSRDTSRVIARVREGTRAIVTRHGEPAVVIMEIEEAVGLCGTVLLSRQEAERRMFGDELHDRLRRRQAQRLRRMLGGGQSG